MAKYEHLLGQDPLGAFKKIKDDYVRYFKTAYRIDDEKIDRMRMEEINKDDNLYKEPYLEILPEYESFSGIDSIDDLAPGFAEAFGSDDTAREFFGFIKSGLMGYKPYGHQVGMLKKSFVEGRNVVITSGTGSGKTESFLLPLFAQLFKEAKTWPQAHYRSDWFERNNASYSPCQRENEGRTAALRALVLYPMNALVADQMTRLRKALDSDKVRSYMHDHLLDNRFFFGGYNGQTMGAKNFGLLDLEPAKKTREQRRVAEKLDEIHSRFENITNYYNGLPTELERNRKEEVLYVCPRLNDATTAEMLTRWDMQNTPPDIMITNVSMLSIMLMRKAEEGIFEATKRWLQEDPSHVFHLVLDELHLYRGTSGSEVACLIRMLLDTIGLAPTIRKIDEKGNSVIVPNPQLRILASSASLGSTERDENGEKSETEKYLEEFFGVYNSSGADAFEVQKGSNYCPECKDDNGFSFSIFQEILPRFIELDDEAQLEQMNLFAQRHGSDTIKDFTLKNQTIIFAKLYSAIPKNEDKSKTPRAISLSNLARALFDGVDAQGNSPALQGFLIYRAFVDKLNENGTIRKSGEKALAHRLPRIRFHQFFKYIEGLWGELQPTLREDQTKAIDAKGIEVSPIKRVMYEAQEVGESGNKVLELLRCENCGELFIGGNRRAGQRGEAMSLNYPELSKMPSFNPTPMVQNKSYKDYMIFWPTHGEPDQDTNGQVAMLGTGEYIFARTNGRGGWSHAYLHTKTGVIKEVINNEPDKEMYIEGYKYVIRPYNRNSPLFIERIQALPCSCPHCAMDYARRIHVKSPIRSFRTGIDRSNQLLSKELMYQLSENSQKLIGFSDSREDAAKQAYGIELEQYRDMVRMLFIDCVKEINNGVETVVEQIEKDRASGVNVDSRRYTSKFDSWLLPTSRQIADDYLDGLDLTRYKQDYVDLSFFIDNANNIDGMLVKKLVQLGINPAGVDYKDQFTTTDRTDSNHWNRAFNWQTFVRNANVNNDYCARVYNNLTSAVFANSFGKYMGVSVLDSGIGYICCKRSDAKLNSLEFSDLRAIISPLGLNVYDFIDAFIRVLGDNYRYSNEDFEEPQPIGGYRNFGKYKKYIEAIAENYQINAQDLGNALYSYFNRWENDAIVLRFDNLGFRLLNKEAEYYECPRCHRVHPNRGMGVCTSCAYPLLGQPVPGKTVKDLWEHFISYDILVEKKEPRRLHTEELTGQTDDIQTRLLEFKNLILLRQGDEIYRKGEERTKEIDMVNVTTTMEVGVDIGSLEAIFQGNMSPTRYNYQQRVGRGGRRGQAFSTAFTFCRGRSHDVHYYKNATDEIVGGLPAAPKLSLAPYADNKGHFKLKLAIIKRVLTKHVLKEAFKEKQIGYEPRLHDTSGEFGLPFEWDMYKPDIEDWIRNHSRRIDEILDLYTAQFNTQECNISTDIDALKNWVRGPGMLEEISAVAHRSTYADGLAQCLAEGGLLPMYGMPSDLRIFYHGFNSGPQVRDLRTIDRSSEMAISEFAPGSEKTKDKGKYRVEGLSTPLRYEEVQGNIVPMNPLDLDALSDCYIMQIDPGSMQGQGESAWRIESVEVNQDALTSKTQIAMNLQSHEKLLVAPKAYRSYKLFENDGRFSDSNDRGSHFSQSTIFAKDNNDTSNSKLVNNVKISAYGLNLNDDALVWHINTNNNRLFRGKYAGRAEMIDGVETRHIKRCPNCRNLNLDLDNGTYRCLDCGHSFDEGSVVDEFVSSNAFMFYRRFVRQGNPPKEYINAINENENYSFDIAIGSRKPTEMIKLEIIDANSFIDLNLDTGNEPAIRAAFFSAAFLIQRTLADKLDVSPDEIEISDKTVIENGRKKVVIYLNDAAPNGAGIVSYLYQENHLKAILEDITGFKTAFMQSLISDKHRLNCKTACQDCLLTYSNRGFHHVLDWRLGVSLLRLMLDSKFDFGFNPATRGRYQELYDYDHLVVECAQKLRQMSWKEGFYYHQAEFMRDVDNIIIYHPLWSKIRLIAMAKSDEISMTNLAIYNIFRVLRSDLDKDKLPQNYEQIPARALNDQGEVVDPNTQLVLGIDL